MTNADLKTMCWHVRADYTTALDKITDTTADSDATSAHAKGVTATAAEYVRSGAQVVAQKAKEVWLFVLPCIVSNPCLSGSPWMQGLRISSNADSLTCGNVCSLSCLRCM